MIGASVAYHLAARGVRDIVVLERAPRPGDGSTGRATGGIRVQFAHEIDARLSLLALERLRAFADETGGDCGYLPAGYLFLARTDDELRELRANLAVQHAAGATEVREVDCREIAALNPALALDGIVGGTFGPRDGFIRPLQILDGYQAAAQRLGVRFIFDAPVVECERSGERLTAVRTPHDRFAADLVVNAAGAWAGEFARLAGADLPVVPLRRQVAVTEPTDVLPATMPMTAFVGDGFHARVRDGRVLLLRASPGAADPFDTSIDPAWVDDVTRRAHARLPVLANVPIDRAACWGGLYEQSPDDRAIVGPAPELPNLWYVNGSSGHGVMHAPALGALVSEWIVDGRSSRDLTALSPARFAQPLEMRSRAL